MEENRNSNSGAPESAENIFALSVSKGEESFPVLKAFQDFLDAERERARRRQLTLAISFMAALVVVVVLFCGIGAILFSGMVTRNDAKQDKLLEVLLSQRTAVQQPSVTVVPAPRAEPDPIIAEMMAVLKQLRAETAELKAAAAVAEAANASAQSAPAVPEVKPEAREVKPETPAKKTGVFSSPKRRPEAVPTPTPEATVSENPVSEDLAEESPSTQGSVEVSPVVEVKSDPDAIVQVKVAPSRTMHLPEGYEASELSVVTEGNVKFPWRILMPTGAETKDATQ